MVCGCIISSLLSSRIADDSSKLDEEQHQDEISSTTENGEQLNSTISDDFVLDDEAFPAEAETGSQLTDNRVVLVLNGAEHELDGDGLFEHTKYEISDYPEGMGSNPGELFFIPGWMHAVLKMFLNT